MVQYIQDHWWKLLLVLNYLLVIVFSILIVLRNSNPVKTLSYIFALATLPFLGLLVYYFVGQDYRKNKIFEKKYFLDDAKLKSWRERFKLDRDEREDFEEEFGEGLAKIHRLLRYNERSVLTFDNEVDILVNGEVKFERLRQDLRKAKKHIHMEYFVFLDDELGRDLIDILVEKAADGVKVRLLYDDVGSKFAAATKKKMNESGIAHFPFMPVHLPKFASKLNYRDHRKIVVIDGSVGYVGGINVNKKYDNSYDNPRYWRDTHLRIEGPAVGSLQASFLLSWDFCNNEEEELINEFFPEHKPECSDPVGVQIAASGPDTDWANIMEAMFTAINTAREYIYITTPYLIPNNAMLTALSTAGRSGVDVRIIIPYESDSWAAQYATDSYIEELLRSKVKIFRYTKGFIHSKTMVLDDIFSSIGTANLDYRSFSINFEINALLYNRNKALEMKELFEKDLEDCDVVDLDRWLERGIRRKLQESFNRLWAPLL
ncbi:cardiolipin synthase [Zeaxanthinibacter enoshimensis]|uniref:Cardiolipin synthase n=1 Tax=Zeaxanthinibacter enoshimensis TaxID=392009 RepID=A0A4R6TMX8_9FLAO|nr:cardiolipin synthase [Zeaxanthinibacter enoshimensis]TDQ29441.1 cardiolipin synthase [Zeaxanthinibacter enoshimensis]